MPRGIYERTKQKRPEDLYWAYVDKTPTCWLWTGGRNSDGYGSFTNRSWGNVKAHRKSWELAHEKPVPKGLYVLHTCDVPACVNPAHLWVGTQKDNMQDCIKKGRLHRARGENNGCAKLTEKDVRYIRSHPNTVGTLLAKRFNVTAVLIGHVRNYRAWVHVTC